MGWERVAAIVGFRPEADTRGRTVIASSGPDVPSDEQRGEYAHLPCRKKDMTSPQPPSKTELFRQYAQAELEAPITGTLCDFHRRPYEGRRKSPVSFWRIN